MVKSCTLANDCINIAVGIGTKLALNCLEIEIICAPVVIDDALTAEDCQSTIINPRRNCEWGGD